MKVNDTIIFSVGFIAGAFITYFAVKKKFEALADEEISAMEEYYNKNNIKKAKNKNEAKDVHNGTNIKDKEIIDRVGYDKIPKNEGNQKNMKEDYSTTPYVISDEEFEMDDEYDKEALIYYAGNDYLIDEDADEALEISIYIGREALNRFNQDNIVYVRNERLRTDYEIHKEDSEYEEVSIQY